MEEETESPSPGPEVPGRRVISRSARKEEILEQSLVLASQGIRHWMEFDGEQFTLTLEEAALPLAMEVLDLYRDENAGFRDAELPPGQIELYLAPLLHLAIPVAAYFWVGLQPWANWLTSQGTADARAMLEGGEWWRCLTATTLHADHEHFLGNVLSGFFILNLLNHRVGMGTIMLLSTLGAGATNLLVALASGPDHRSLGFSSVVFCALGMLGAVESTLIRRRKDWSLRRLAPLIAAFFIAVMVGLGENADVKAHFYGFGIGAALGFLARFLPKGLGRPPWQLAFACATYAAYVLAWRLAYGS
jgi:membrane associated rhomboid family serine protease